MTRRPRGLRPEERELWDRIARSAHALHPEAHRIAHPDEKPALKPAKPKLPLAAFRLGEAARHPPSGVTLIPGPAEDLARQPLRMDARAHKKMTKGRTSPEARIDLHGMTLAEAHPELIRFILNAQAQGLRLVLVITGKGKRRDDQGPIPMRMGVLRHQVPAWLAQMPLAPAVLQIASAHLKHGGEGAYYVYLRSTG
jgi:DNA-nicking Smr family endonuclease